MTTSFALHITNQHWLGEREEQARDGCSHGGISAVIGGTRVTSDKLEYGISQSALSLLRTLEQDHTPSDRVNGSYLLCHGCTYPTHFGCPNFGTDWVVRHEDGTVFLSQPLYVDSVAGDTEFDVQARVTIEHYRREVAAFAETARSFYFSAEPRALEEWEQDLHEQFWAEFDERLERARSARTADWPASRAGGSRGSS